MHPVFLFPKDTFKTPKPYILKNKYSAEELALYCM